MNNATSTYATELTVNYLNLADAMGFAPTTGGASTTIDLYRVSTGVVQEVTDGSDSMPKIVNSPVFKIKKGEEAFLARSIDIRFFAERQRWQKWDSTNNSFQRSVMSTNLNADMKDTLGTFNLGRPSGFIKDFKVKSSHGYGYI